MWIVATVGFPQSPGLAVAASDDAGHPHGMKSRTFTPRPVPEGLRDSRGERGVLRAFDAGRMVRLISPWYVNADQWVAAAPWERTELMAAAIAAARPKAVFCGTTAIQLAGLPVPSIAPYVHLVATSHTRLGRQRDTFDAVDPEGKVPRAPRRWTHLLQPNIFRRVHVGGYTTVDLACSLIQVASELPLEDALPALDAALSRDAELVTLEALHQRLEIWPVDTQAARAANAIAVADGRAESAMESRARALFLLMGFEPPVLQESFTDERGFIGRVDFWWPRAGLVVEYDGEGKWLDLPHSRRDQWSRIQADQERHARLVAHPRVRRMEHLVKKDLTNAVALAARLQACGLSRDLNRAARLRLGLLLAS